MGEYNFISQSRKVKKKGKETDVINRRSDFRKIRNFENSRHERSSTRATISMQMLVGRGVNRAQLRPTRGNIVTRMSRSVSPLLLDSRQTFRARYFRTDDSSSERNKVEAKEISASVIFIIREERSSFSRSKSEKNAKRKRRREEGGWKWVGGEDTYARESVVEGKHRFNRGEESLTEELEGGVVSWIRDTLAVCLQFGNIRMVRRGK